MDLNSDDLLEVGFDAVEISETRLPEGMAGRVLAAAARDARAAMHPAWLDSPIGPSPHVAFIQTAAELGDLLDTLEPADWSRPTRVPGTTVHDLVVHLVGVERYVLGQLGERERLHAPTRELHAPVARLAASDLLGEPGPSVARAWWREVLEVIAACGKAGPDRPHEHHHLPGTVRGLLVVRTFELWTHGDDIRAAIGRDLNPLDDERLSLMATQLMEVLPLGLALSGCTRPGNTARIELTGPGGATFIVPLAPGEVPGEPDVSVTVSTIDMCRLAANRLTTPELDAVVVGAAGLVEPILVGARAFAAD